MFGIFEIALHDAKFEIVDVVTICIEMQWQRKKLFMPDRVCVIIKYQKFPPVSPIYYASMHFLAMN